MAGFQQELITFYVRKQTKVAFQQFVKTTNEGNMTKWLNLKIEQALKKAGYVDESGQPAPFQPKPPRQESA